MRKASPHQARSSTYDAQPTDRASGQAIAVAWVTSTWHDDHDTRAAIATLARLGETCPEFDLGLFIGLTALLPSWLRRQLALGRLTPIKYELTMSQTVARAAWLTVTESVQQS